VIQFGVLGPLDVKVEDRTVDLGGPRQRSLLAALLLHPGEPVSAEMLAQMLWGDEAPPSAAKALQVTVSRLRAALGAAGDRLETVSGGYRLRVQPGELDAEAFEQAYDRARALAPAGAAPALREALGMWRGPALVDVRYEPWAQGEIRRLEELRASVVEDRVTAELERGEHARLVGELEALVAEFPLRERLRALQMLALYRSGRHADALAAYRAAREALDTELGLEPGPELRNLEQQILIHDPALQPAAPGVPAPPATPTFGRDDDVLDVLAALEGARLVTLTGPGGVGKTRLAIEVARAAGGRFVPLAPIADDDRIPEAACAALGVHRMPGEAALAALRRTLRQAPTLLVLDNLEHLPGVAELIASLLDTVPTTTVLATSRQPLRLGAERVRTVAPLATESSVALFVERAAARGPTIAPTDAVVDICTTLGGLPLAIELAAGRLGVLTPEQLATRLSDALAVLGRGPEDAPERHRTLRATLDWSFELLAPAERDAFTALAAFAGGCELDAAEAVTDAPLSVLEELVDKGLVTAQAGRLGMLEPVRQYAQERLAERSDADDVRRRHLEFHLDLVRASEEAILAHTRTAPEYARMQRERENIRVAIEWALDRGLAVDALTLVGLLGPVAWISESDAEFAGLARRSLDEAGADAPAPLRGRALFTLGQVLPLGLERMASIDAALALFRAVGDELWIVNSLIAISNFASFSGDYAHGRAVAEEALERAHAFGDSRLIGSALGQVALGTAPAVEAAALIREAATHLRAAGAVEIATALLSTAGMAALREDEYELSAELQYEALEMALAMAEPFSLASVYGNLGLAALLGGRADTARGAFRDELLVARAHGFGLFYFEGLLGLAALAAADGEDRRAIMLDGAAWALREREVYASEAPVYGRLEERFISAGRDRLGAEAAASAAAAGRHMSAAAALAYALAEPAVSAELPD
jgi:predicted ATPase/DNA-binding SARP family transcriptional activator